MDRILEQKCWNIYLFVIEQVGPNDLVRYLRRKIFEISEYFELPTLICISPAGKADAAGCREFQNCWSLKITWRMGWRCVYPVCAYLKTDWRHLMQQVLIFSVWRRFVSEEQHPQRLQDSRGHLRADVTGINSFIHFMTHLRCVSIKIKSHL